MQTYGRKCPWRHWDRSEGRGAAKTLLGWDGEGRWGQREAPVPPIGLGGGPGSLQADPRLHPP